MRNGQHPQKHPNGPTETKRNTPRVSREAFIALRKALRYLASRDYDHARKRNAAGFNKADSKIGHALARKEKWTPQDLSKAIELAHRYRRQLPEGIRRKLPNPTRDGNFKRTGFKTRRTNGKKEGTMKNPETPKVLHVRSKTNLWKSNKNDTLS